MQTLAPRTLKLAIVFAGLAGIMSEYLLSTVATYLLGDAVKQWALIISTMLLAMGLGSGASVGVKRRLIDVFILVEVLLSFFIGISVLAGYLVIPYMGLRYIVLYALSFCIGFLIGYEIPLATRINDQYEELRVNIAGIMQRDYIGAFIGGLLFVFVAVPYFGLTYIPVTLALVNFLIAVALFYAFNKFLELRKTLITAFLLLFASLLFIAFRSEAILFYQEQKLYRDEIAYFEQTPYQRIVVTKWKDDFWLYLNGNQQFSSFDEERYHEPMVHPAMLLARKAGNVLVLGGGDGLAVREILKHPTVKRVTLVDLDPAVTNLARKNEIFVKLNDNALNDKRVSVINQDGYAFLELNKESFDVIFVDLPDPKSTDLSRLYSHEFYLLCKNHLSRDGILVTQSVSPVFSRNSFMCILKTLEVAGFVTLPYHVDIPTMGDWGWMVSVQQETGLKTEAIRERFMEVSLSGLSLRFLTQDLLKSLPVFWKDAFKGMAEIKPNRLLEPNLLEYYKNDRWDLY